MIWTTTRKKLIFVAKAFIEVKQQNMWQHKYKRITTNKNITTQLLIILFLLN